MYIETLSTANKCGDSRYSLVFHERLYSSRSTGPIVSANPRKSYLAMWSELLEEKIFLIFTFSYCVPVFHERLYSSRSTVGPIVSYF